MLERLFRTALLLIATGPGAVHAAGQPGLPDPDETLKHLADKYRLLQAYADQGTMTAILTGAGAPRERTAEVPIAFVRPNQFAVELGDVAVLSDGVELITIDYLRKRHSTERAPPQISIDDAGGDAASIPTNRLLEAIGALPTWLILTLLTEDDAVGKLHKRFPVIRAEADREGDNRRFHVLSLAGGEVDLRFLLLINAQSGYLEQIETTRIAAGSGLIRQELTLTLTWSAGRVMTDPKAINTVIERRIGALSWQAKQAKFLFHQFGRQPDVPPVPAKWSLRDLWDWIGKLFSAMQSR